jgi:hypothetical protein
VYRKQPFGHVCLAVDLAQYLVWSGFPVGSVNLDQSPERAGGTGWHRIIL